MRTYCKKGGCHWRQACIIDVEKQYHHRDIFSRWINLEYDIYLGLTSVCYLEHSSILYLSSVNILLRLILQTCYSNQEKFIREIDHLLGLLLIQSNLLG